MLEAMSDLSVPGNSCRTFCLAALRRPTVIGGLLPSSGRLAAQLAAIVPERPDQHTVVELGPGTGPISRAVQERLGGKGTHLALEIDPTMAAHLRGELPVVDVVEADAAELDQVLVNRGLAYADSIVASLPWSLMTERTQIGILDGVARRLADDGAFTTVAYLNTLVQPSARRFRALLHERFDEVLTTSPIWRNVPPAVTYVCRRPLR